MSASYFVLFRVAGCAFCFKKSKLKCGEVPGRVVDREKRKKRAKNGINKLIRAPLLVRLILRGFCFRLALFLGLRRFHSAGLL